MTETNPEINDMLDIDRESFNLMRKAYLKQDLYDGTCPFCASGGECTDFNWECCSVCPSYTEDND